MTFQTRNKVLALDNELVTGVVPSTIGDADKKALAITEATLEPNTEFFEDNALRGTLTPSPGIATFVPATLRTVFSFRGKKQTPSPNTAAPAFSPLLDSAGMRRYAASALKLTGAVSGGPFRAGEIITGTTSSATARVLHDASDDSGHLIVGDITGGPFVISETLTGGSTGATVTTAGATPQTSVGWTWHTVSQPLKSIALTGTPTVTAKGAIITGNTSGAFGILEVALTAASTEIVYRLYHGNFIAGEDIDVVGGASGVATVDAGVFEQFVQGGSMAARLWEDGVRKTLRGGRTNLTIDITIGAQTTITAETQGVYDGEVDEANPTGFSVDGRSPALAQNIPIRIAAHDAADIAAERQLCLLSAIQFQTANGIVRIPSACDTGGVREQAITSRVPVGSMDPERTLEADFSWLGKFRTGALARLYTEIGSEAGNKMLITAPGLQFRAMPVGDREGRQTYQVGFNLTGGNIGNLAGGAITLNELGADNELVLTYMHTLAP